MWARVLCVLDMLEMLDILAGQRRPALGFGQFLGAKL